VRLPGAHQPEDPQDLAGAHFERQVVQERLGTQVFHPEDRRTGLGNRLGILLRQAASHHHTDQRVFVRLFDGQRADHAPIAHHRDARADARHLVQAVRDVNHANAALLQAANDVK